MDDVIGDVIVIKDLLINSADMHKTKCLWTTMTYMTKLPLWLSNILCWLIFPSQE